MNYINYIQSLDWEKIGATLISGYTFIKAHGGLTTIWSDFRGPLAPTPSGIKANETITQLQPEQQSAVTK